MNGKYGCEMDQRCRAIAYAYILARRRQRNERMVRIRQQSVMRRRRFARKQAQERLMFFLMIATAYLYSHGVVSSTRMIWAKERSTTWWEQVVNSTFTEQDWLENFRMSRTTFLYLCDELRSGIEKQNTVMRRAVSTEKRVAITLWFLATGADYRTIGHLFGVSKSTVCVVTKEVCVVIVERLLPDYIKMPTGTALKVVVEGFKNDLGFPQCAGAVDGTHIPILSPQECPADYYNRKGWHSILMQGVVDHQGRFVDVYIGWPGRVHDARVFANSSLYQRGQSKTLLPDWKETIGGRNVPLVLLGDPAYPLLQWLMKAFPDNGRLSQQEKHFNYRLSRARVVVEHSYGRLKGRWRCLLRRLDVSTSDVPKLVAACCVLHNVCEIHGDKFNDQWMEGVQGQESVRTSAGSSSTLPEESAVDIRKAFMSYFIAH